MYVMDSGFGKKTQKAETNLKQKMAVRNSKQEIEYTNNYCWQ